MRKLTLFLLIITLLNSCAYQDSLIHYEHNFLIDFREFSKDGFLFSSSNYGGEYESVGILTTSYFPEVTLIPKKHRMADIDTSKYNIAYGFKVEKVNYDDIFSAMHIKAKKLGADAVVDIVISREVHPGLRYYKSNPYNSQLEKYGMGWIVKGMAIKRK